MAQPQRPHILVTLFLGQVSPILQFVKRLTHLGACVTLLTPLSILRSMHYKPIIPNLTYTSFSDGYDDGFNDKFDDAKHSLFISELQSRGSEALANLITSKINEGQQFTALTYTIFFSWAAKVARRFHLPSVLIWTQPATVLAVYYYSLGDYKDYIESQRKDPESRIKLPKLPSLTCNDLPSFILKPSDIFSFARPSLEEHLQEFEKEAKHWNKKPIVLVNTFEALELEALKAVDEINMIPIGPLILSAFLNGEDPNDTSFGSDIYHHSDGYMEWLDSQAVRSVVYVSFGSLHELSERQTKEIAHALLNYGRPFLWVIRESSIRQEEKEENKWREKLEEKGRIVKWCSQVEVLGHSSVGCFMTHCGWNSSKESLVSGVPMVGFAQFSDQPTNAKLIEEEWKIGVRVRVKEEEEGGRKVMMAESEEIRRCFEVVMGNGEKGEELRRNARKWKELAMEAGKKGGSSYENLGAFLNMFA